MKIKDLDFQPHPNKYTGGERAVVTFPNGYSASVLRGGTAYTENGTYEIAVMRDGQIDYSTPITDDVLGYLSTEEAEQALAGIAALPQP